MSAHQVKMVPVRENGGPAFPIINGHSNGMMLRDYFAGQALSEVLRLVNSSSKFKDAESHEALVATAAYRIADAMIAGRGVA